MDNEEITDEQIDIKDLIELYKKKKEKYKGEAYKSLLYYPR